ncbi:hypothetical protein [Streptomyces sp. 891-h]|uniref:hypothetical protein n=1 Tax=Streptomyces sp. 891-h TaxID=2720714 RepID=UPI001FAAB4B6|nr:hypothetical protein [Streptomyces sp. 891-h]UNZ21252.1 hypothetical protein HC362_33430 [Streptomyces sp. 891-h]
MNSTKVPAAARAGSITDAWAAWTARTPLSAISRAPAVITAVKLHVPSRREMVRALAAAKVVR